MAFIWKISIDEFKDKSLIKGIILEGQPPRKYKSKGSIRNFARVISSYFKKPYIEKKLILYSGDQQFNIITDIHGGFYIELNQRIDPDFKILAEGQSQPLEIIQDYPVFFPESDFPINIISDVDDTILVSHTASLWKRISTLLFVSPYRREQISFTMEILNKIGAEKGRIFYVSKSEGNLFGILSTFIENKDLPLGNLNLTPYLRYNQLLNPKKGKDYKEQIIKSIIEFSSEKRFILIGDDTQQDIAVYTNIAQTYPDRILKIYIRKTLKNLSGNKREQMNKLHALPVSTLYFNDESDPEEEIKLIQNH